MEEVKIIILKTIIVQIKNVAQRAMGTTSYWGMYQPKEPKIVDNHRNKLD